MKPEDKELLLKDLCGRLPYGVKCQFEDTIRITDGESSPFYDYVLSAHHLELFIRHNNFYIKPYLRPISSMTEEETVEYCDLQDKFLLSSQYPVTDGYALFDWLNKKMFDYRGLIPKGSALEAPEGMYDHKTKLEFQAACPEVDPDEVNENGSRIKVGCKIRSKTNPNEILSIISDDCHGDEFECANGAVLSLKQIEKYYDLI